MKTVKTIIQNGDDDDMVHASSLLESYHLGQDGESRPIPTFSRPLQLLFPMWRYYYYPYLIVPSPLLIITLKSDYSSTFLCLNGMYIQMQCNYSTYIMPLQCL